MLITPPKIDSRNQQVIVDQLKKLIQHYCPDLSDSINAGTDQNAEALMHIFARMMELIIQRLNKVPEKNFLSFLDLMGITLTPPKVAKAPLTFKMVAGASQYGFIPARTQVAASVKDQSVVFETEKDLTIILPKLVKIISLNTSNDEWNNHSSILVKDNPAQAPEELFTGKERVAHRLYLGDQKLFSFKEKVTIIINLVFNGATNLNKSNLQWYCYIDDPKAASNIKSLPTSTWEVLDDQTVQITLDGVEGIAAKTLTEKEKTVPDEIVKSWNNFWLFAQLEVPVTQMTIPGLTSVTAGIQMNPTLKTGTGTITQNNTAPFQIAGNGTQFMTELKRADFLIVGQQTRMVVDISSNTELLINYPFNPGPSATGLKYTSSRAPEQAFYNNWVLDLTKDLYPFGERPKFNDTFYIGSKEVFSKQGALITIMVALSNGVDLPDTQNISLGWEFWDGNLWTKFTTKSTEQSQLVVGVLEDLTAAFTQNGRIRFICPAMEKIKVNNEENYWLRVRIVGGNYGKEATYKEDHIDDGTGTGNTKSVWTYQEATYKPPVINSLAMTYEVSPTQTKLETVLTYNDFIYQDYSKFYRGEESSNEPIVPFRRYFETQQAIYFAFDQDIATLPVNLYFQLQRNFYSYNGKDDGNISIQSSEIREAPVIMWEYWNGGVWQILSVEDGTKNLAKPEIVQFSAPKDLKKKLIFGGEYYWFRTRLEGNYLVPPKLEALYNNTVWAHNQTTVKNEILGSSNGDPNQSFKFSKCPVLSGQWIFVRETALTEVERLNIIAREGHEAIKEDFDSAGNLVELWVRWQEVNNFFFSESNSRHYRIDRSKGIIFFGDAVHGMIPPIGKDNIRCFGYQYGGGILGNVKAGTITKLRTTIPYVDSVTNPTEAEGGFDQENLERAKIRGPQTLKNRDRAVSYEDFEWLVREASPKVAKVKCLSLSDQKHPGRINIIIVPESEEPKPLVTEELLGEVEEYLSLRTSGFLTQNTGNVEYIKLIEPGYLQVNVTAGVRIKDLNAAKIILSRVTDILKKFFHPIYGGPEQQGWEFGRNVYISEVYEAIENTEGVDYVEYLILNASIQIYMLTITIKSSLNYLKKSTVKTMRPEGEIVFLLAEDINRTNIVNPVNITFGVTGFKEGDSIVLTDCIDPDKSQKLIIKTVVGNQLECEPVGAGLAPLTFPTRSVVESASAVKSYLVYPVEVSNNKCRLTVALFLPSDKIVITQNLESTEPLTINTINDQVETGFIDDNYLVYSGVHQIEQVNNGEV